MTIASAIATKQQQVVDCYTAVSSKGATLPLTQNLTHLASTISQLGMVNSGLSFTFNQYPESLLTTNIYAYNTFLNEYCMATVGSKYFILSPIYDNYNVQGTLTVNDGVASGFSTANYIYLGKNFTANANSWAYIIKATTGNDVSTTQFLFSNYHVNGNVFGIASGKVLWYASSNNSSWDLVNAVAGTTTLSANTTYYFKLEFTGTAYNCYVSTTGAFAGEETLEISSSSTGKILSSDTYFGVQVMSNGNFLPWLGTIDINHTSITINGSLWWSALNYYPVAKDGLLASGVTDDGTAKTYNVFYNNGFAISTASSLTGYSSCGAMSVPSHTVYPAYKDTGQWSLTSSLKYEGFLIKGFSGSQYINTNYTFAMTTSEFEQGFNIQIHFKTPSTWSGQYERLLTCGTGYSQGGFIAIRANGLGFDVGLSNGGSVLLNIIDTTTQLQADTEYWVKFTKPNTQFFESNTTLQLSEDGQTWQSIGISSTVISTNITANGVTALGYAPDSSAQYFRGKIDIRDTFISIAGTQVFGLSEQ